MKTKMERENRSAKKSGIRIEHTFDAECPHDDCLGECGKREAKPAPQHTPLPWHIEQDYKTGMFDIVDENKKVVALVDEARDGGDCAFIIKAVNNHEAILQAAKDALALYYRSTTGGITAHNLEAGKIKDTIRKAEAL